MRGTIVFLALLALSTEASFFSKLLSRFNLNPPHYKDVALMARYIIHNSDWLTIATISTQKSIEGFPFVSLKSLSDGPMDNSTGIPFLYMTDMDVSGQDILKNNNVTIMATLAESDYCTNKNYDPQDPRCAKVIISGKLLKVSTSSAEYEFGKESLFERHPAMKDWPTDHEFYVAKVDLRQILVLDFFGGIKTVTPNDYFNANVSNLINLDSYFRRISVVPIGNNL
ncbi:protein CREG1 [Anthonomus grandis grandis]|uniref:protein CREG1 n=1 Tax=Anthonomus grandis grandis TaxID=2921223 RepID=UPI0021666DAD|nr:protein CREG1 [Anthonomus grandis grandis]